MLTKMYANCAAFLCTLKNDERGVTAIEYALVAVAVAGIVVAAFGTAGVDGSSSTGLVKALETAFEKVAAAITSAAS